MSDIVLSTIRWIARVASVASLGALAWLIVGEGFNPLHLPGKELVLCLLFPFGVALGLALGWRWEGVGGVLSLGCLAGFYGLHFATEGRFPKGWAFAAMTSPALLFLLSWAARKSKKRS